jgi:hypothetical protein
MTIANMLSITSNPFLSMMIWIVLLLATLYFARKPFHRSVGSLAKIIHNAMRLTAATVISAEKKLVRRNREVLMAAGLQKAERLVEREFDRITSAVVRDLANYPYLQRRLLELTTRLDEDYSSGADVPPSLPNWRPIIEPHPDGTAQVSYRELPQIERFTLWNLEKNATGLAQGAKKSQ